MLRLFPEFSYLPVHYLNIPVYSLYFFIWSLKPANQILPQKNLIDIFIGSSSNYSLAKGE